MERGGNEMEAVKEEGHGGGSKGGGEVGDGEGGGGDGAKGNGGGGGRGGDEGKGEDDDNNGDYLFINITMVSLLSQCKYHDDDYDFDDDEYIYHPFSVD